MVTPEHVKEWSRNKLKALTSLLGKLGVKAEEALPAIIVAIISLTHNKAKEVVGWVSQKLWPLVVGVGGLLYIYIVMRNYRCFHHGNDIQSSKNHKTPLIPTMLTAMNANSLSCCSLLRL